MATPYSSSSKPLANVTPEAHALLSNICEAWKFGKNDKKVMTMANEAIGILAQANLASKQQLPNECVASLAVFPAPELRSIEYRLRWIEYRLKSIFYRPRSIVYRLRSIEYRLKSIFYRPRSIVYRPRSIEERLKSIFVITKVGSDLSNRKGLGLNVDQVYCLGGDLFGIGWSDAIPDPCAITSKPDSMDLLNFNMKLVRESEGRLPQVEPHRMQYFALSCNHTVWFLKCVAAELPCDMPDVSINGHLNISAIEQTDKLFAKRIREGMAWLVIDWRVREFYPEVVELIIEAKNAPGEINRRTSAFEVLTQIWKLSTATKDARGLPDWPKVQRMISRSRPPCVDLVPELVEFVVNCSGGSSGAFLRELTDLWKQCQLGKMTRNVPKAVWRALARSGNPEGDSMARFKNMCVLTTLSAEAGTIEDGICTLFTEGDCTIFRASRESTVARLKMCNDMLNDGFDLISRVSAKLSSDGATAPSDCGGAPAPPGSVGATAPLGSVLRAHPATASSAATFSKMKLLFACRLVRFVLSEQKNRQRPGECFKTAGAIGFELLQGLRQLFDGTDTLATNAIIAAWVPDVENKKEQKLAPTGVRLKEMTAEGKLAHLEDQLNQIGFKIGDHLKEKNTGDLWIIAACEKDCVVMEELPGRNIVDRNITTVKEFAARFTKPPDGYENKLLHCDPSWQLLGPQTSRGGAAALAKMDVLAALTVAARLHPDATQAVQPMLNLKNGSAGVQAASNAKAGTIVLVPWTSNIIIDFPDEASFKKPAQWIVDMTMIESALADFASEEGAPRISLASQVFSEKVDLKAKKEKAESAKAAKKLQERMLKESKQEKEASEKAEKLKAAKEKVENEKAAKEKAQKEAKMSKDEKEKAEKKASEAEMAEEEEKQKPKPHMSLFWRLQSFSAKENKDAINMDVGHITVDTLGTIVEQSKNIGAKHSRKPDFAASARTTKVVIPVLVNRRDVIKGEFLVYEKMNLLQEKAIQLRPINQSVLVRNLLSGAVEAEPAQQAHKKARLL